MDGAGEVIELGAHGRFVIRRRLWVSHHADVYEARPPGGGRARCVKRLHEGIWDYGEDLVARLREAVATGPRPVSERWVQIEAAPLTRAAPVVVSGYVDGPSLVGVRRLGPAPAGVAAHVAAEVLAAVRELPRAEHDALYPSHVLLSSAGAVKLLPCSLTPVIHRPGNRYCQGILSFAVEFAPLLYAAPEVTRGGARGERAALFTVGILLHELLSGAHPFARESKFATVRALMEADRTPLDPALGVPAAVAGVLDELLSPEPDRRPPSIAAAIARLQRACPDGGAAQTSAWIAPLRAAVR